ncbi:MAG: histone deacetylase [Bryobacteraceae bacterium]|nr:histone deacetylase [Bryobacteraceae bacterium]
MRPVIFYTDPYELPLPEGHRFPIAKYRLLRERLAPLDLFDLELAPLADPAELTPTHCADYVRRFLSGTLDPAAMRRIGFPWSEGLVRRTLASVGSTLAATRAALERGWSGSLAGGTHHAFFDYGSGYCVFNDLAVAIRAANRRAAVIDLDVHQGDGTAALFAEDPAVLTFSAHGRHNFPFRKQESKIDLAFDDGTGDDEYLAALRATLPRVFEHRPAIVFYQSGVDTLREDRLGRLALTRAGLAARDALVFDAVASAGVPLVITLGGGYADPIAATVEAHAQTFIAAAARRFT